MTHTVHDPKLILARIKAEASLAKTCANNAALQITFQDLRAYSSRWVLLLLNDGRLIKGEVIAALSELAIIQPPGTDTRLRLKPQDVASIDLA